MQALEGMIVAAGEKQGMSFLDACNDNRFLEDLAKGPARGSANRKSLVAYAKARKALQGAAQQPPPQPQAEGQEAAVQVAAVRLLRVVP